MDELRKAEVRDAAARLALAMWTKPNAYPTHLMTGDHEGWKVMQKKINVR